MTPVDERIRLREDRLVWREAGDEVVALDRETSEYLAVTRSGIELWHALARGATEAELAAMLRERYGLDPERAAADVARFVGDLADRGLLATA
jgi:hypothetical protein